MLEELHVHAYALIDKVSVKFAPGLNVLSGETGAGKSILVGALGLLLGDRTDTSIIRTGADNQDGSGGWDFESRWESMETALQPQVVLTASRLETVPGTGQYWSVLSDLDPSVVAERFDMLATPTLAYPPVRVGELAPKSIALQKTEQTALFVVGPTLVAETVFTRLWFSS